MNPEQAQKIIDRLADKTLSFGCSVKFIEETETERGETKAIFINK